MQAILMIKDGSVINYVGSIRMNYYNRWNLHDYRFGSFEITYHLFSYLFLLIRV